MMVSFEQRVSNARGALLRRWLLCPALSAALLAPLASSSGCSNAATGHGTGGGAAVLVADFFTASVSFSDIFVGP